MPSPFPGMDPYIEFNGVWPGFHLKFINCWQDAINDVLPDRYEARIGIDIQLVARDTGRRRRRRQIGPDVSVTRKTSSASGPVPTTGTATLEPVTIPFWIGEERRRPFLQIIERHSRKLVTVLELLSPSNKDHRGGELYRTKRQTIYFQDVHLFELDLLLGGERLPMRGDLPPGDYYALISRFDRRPACEVFAWTVRQTLPILPIPLTAPDPDVFVDLQAVFTTTYDRGRYARSLDYEQSVAPNLEPATARWISARAKSEAS